MSMKRNIKSRMSVGRREEKYSLHKDDVEADDTKNDHKVGEDIEKKYKVANYRSEHVEAEHSDVFHKTSVNFKTLVLSAFHVDTFKSAILGVTWRPVLLFLVLYYAFQILYRQGLLKEKGWKEWVSTMKDHDSTATRYLTFILGFYVGQTIKRWWDQIRSLPYIEPITNCMAGFVQLEFQEDIKGKEAALELRKKIARYCLLSWTMCMATISPPLREKFKTGENFIEKGLMTDKEMIAFWGAKPSSWRDQWWIPINWATSIINANHPDSQGCKIKDQKDFIGQLNRFLDKLHHVAKYQHNPLPLIYGQAVMVAIYSWIILGVFGSQYVSKNEEEVMDALAIFRTFPFFQIVKIVLMYAWLKVAHIIRNPFGQDQHYDINLEQMLDQNIWKASVSIKHMDNPIYF